ncbi:MAG: DinB family protein [Gemmatimonadaceae bacterium]
MTTSSSGGPADILYTDLENELRTTRRMLERFPAGNNDWRPHEKSMTLGRLAAHVAELPQFGTMIVTTDGMDFATSGYKPTICDTSEELLAVFDEKVKALRLALGAADSSTLASTWTLRNGEQVFFTRPKGELVRHMMINHLVHHRAQLGVYYRMLGVALPRSYGPSADEPM